MILFKVFLLQNPATKVLHVCDAKNQFEFCFSLPQIMVMSTASRQIKIKLV